MSNLNDAAIEAGNGLRNSQFILHTARLQDRIKRFEALIENALTQTFKNPIVLTKEHGQLSDARISLTPAIPTLSNRENPGSVSFTSVTAAILEAVDAKNPQKPMIVDQFGNSGKIELDANLVASEMQSINRRIDASIKWLSRRDFPALNKALEKDNAFATLADIIQGHALAIDAELKGEVGKTYDALLQKIDARDAALAAGKQFQAAVEPDEPPTADTATKQPSPTLLHKLGYKAQGGHIAQLPVHKGSSRFTVPGIVGSGLEEIQQLCGAEGIKTEMSRTQAGQQVLRVRTESKEAFLKLMPPSFEFARQNTVMLQSSGKNGVGGPG